jgi:hypothetical protein
VSLGRQNINYNVDSVVGTLELRFARSIPNIFNDSYPVIVALPVGNNLSLDSHAKIFKFAVTNAGTRDLRFASVDVAVDVSTLVGGESIVDLRLYEDNGAGGLGTYVAQFNTVFNSSTAMPSLIIFNNSNDQNSLLDNMTVAPGATRKFIVTANTTNMSNSQASSSINLSARIPGLIGWGAAAWNIGHLFYYYSPVNNGNTEVGPFSASDYYEVIGGVLNYTF